MDKTMMKQLMRKIAYQYQCDINFSNKCMILQSIKYNFYFYIHLDKLTNDVNKRLFSIETISYVYSIITSMLDIIVDYLNFEIDESSIRVPEIILSSYNKRLKFTSTNMMYLSTELFGICINIPTIQDIETLDKLKCMLGCIEKLNAKLCKLNGYGMGLNICAINRYIKFTYKMLQKKKT